MYSLIVEAYYCTADTRNAKIYGDEVLQQLTLSELEKVRVHSCNISLYGGALNKPREALDMSIDVLRKLGCKFPSNKLLQACLAISLLTTTKLPNEKDIAALPPMEDETKKACMDIMVSYHPLITIYDHFFKRIVPVAYFKLALSILLKR